MGLTDDAILNDLNQYDLLGINPSTGRLSLAELQRLARQVAVILARGPAAGTTAQPVPYTVLQINALRDWLNQSAGTGFHAGGESASRRVTVGEETRMTEQQLLDQFYHDYDRMGSDWVHRSTWNPGANPSTGHPRLHTGDPTIMTPVPGPLPPPRPVIDLTGRSDSSGRRAGSEASFNTAQTGRQASPAAPGPVTPIHARYGGTVNPTTHGRNRSPAVMPSPPSTGWRNRYTNPGTPPSSSGSTGHTAPLADYTGPVMFSLAQLETLAADPTGSRIAIGLVRAVDRHNVAYGPPALVVTAGLDGQGRLNFRVIARSIEGRKIKGAGQSNSGSWAGLTGRGLVLLGRFRNAETDQTIRDFFIARGAGAAAPSSPVTPPTGPRSNRLPLDDKSPTTSDKENEQKAGQTGPSKKQKKDSGGCGKGGGSGGSRKDRWPDDEEEEAMRRAALESWHYRGGRIRGG